MVKKQTGLFPQKHKTLIRISYGIFLCVFTLTALGGLFVIETKESIFDLALIEHTTIKTTAEKIEPAPFPFGVNPLTRAIKENPEVDTYFQNHITSATKDRSKLSWWERNITAKLALFDWYQNLASPLSRILVIRAGERKEEVLKSFGSILRWDSGKQKQFQTLVASSSPNISEGKFFPARYVVEKDATPETVAQNVVDEFNQQVASRYTKDVQKVVPFDDAMIIASLLEREAYDFEDMRYISGVIWNRLFAGMNLQIDASLQYAKANQNSGSWWPVPIPSDKYINSPFNTYKNSGLPPSPIANPSPEAILAALNPRATNCMFYFHDRNANFHCSKTYEEHVTLLKQYYGKGK